MSVFTFLAFGSPMRMKRVFCGAVSVLAPSSSEENQSRETAAPSTASPVWESVTWPWSVPFL